MDQKIADELIRAGLELRHDEDGLVLEGDGMALRASFDDMKHRLLPGKLNRELLVRACKVKGVAAPRLVDATALCTLDESTDVNYLDPMFPGRTKSAAVKKKFQLLHRLEMPCQDEKALLDAALGARPRKIVIKRPIKGPYLAGVKPSYELCGKAVRYDCIVIARDS